MSRSPEIANEGYTTIGTNKEVLKEIMSDPEFNNVNKQDTVELLWRSHKKGNDADDLLFKTKATNKELYEYLRKNPKSARYVMRRYPENADFLKDICDPESPLYIREISDNLSGLIEIENVQKDLLVMKSEKIKLPELH